MICISNLFLLHVLIIIILQFLRARLYSQQNTKDKCGISTVPLTPIMINGTLHNGQSYTAAKRKVFSNFLNVSLSVGDQRIANSKQTVL